MIVAATTQAKDDKPDDKLGISAYIVAGVEDYGAFHDRDGRTSNTHAILRKAKLGLEYRFNPHWSVELDTDYSIVRSEKEFEIDDAIIRYQGLGIGTISVGRMVEPFGFERTTGSSKLATNERSLATSALAPGRSYGAMLDDKTKAYTWAVGVFREEADTDSPRAVTARFTMAPVRSDRHTLHLGVGGSYRDYQGQRFQIKDEGEVISADNVIRSARFDADKLRLIGAEVAWLYRSFTFSSEAMAQRVTQANGTEWDYSGFYTQLGFFPTGEQRQYRKGQFRRIDPLSGYGAVELVARFSYLDARDRELGAEASIGLLGVNYYLGKRLLARLNYLIPDITGNTLQDDPTGEAITLRVQYRL